MLVLSAASMKEPLTHGSLCQCVVCRAERFAKRGVAAQEAVDKRPFTEKGKAAEKERKGIGPPPRRVNPLPKAKKR